ncbi:coiled-coil domain-containing protein 158-like isoform X2 [Antennarius striatus]|uniref:coiled-coil domain-containing protein 158-like isoform X2 n=1 Tax=Antennarius striatus TaxID=241820 RepID=UPI0035B2222E
MSSGVVPQLTCIGGAHTFKLRSSPSHEKRTQTEAGTNESSELRFNRLTLDELSEELDRRTRETQRLQNEVDNATKLTMEKFGYTYDIHKPPGQSCHNHRLNDYDSPVDPTIVPILQQVATQPSVYDLNSSDREVTQRDCSCPEEEVFGTAIDDCLQQLSGFQTHDQPKQDLINSDKAIMNLQTELHQVQTEKDIVSDLRLSDSWKHLDQMEKMLCMLEELQNIKRLKDQKLQETEDQVLTLNSRMKTLEQSVKEIGSSLSSHDKQYGDSIITSPKVAINSRQVFPAQLTEQFDNDTDRLQQEHFLQSAEHQRNEEYCGFNELKDRMEDLIASLGQEMAMLTDKLCSSKNNSVSLGIKLEFLNKLAERQTLHHQCQVGCLEQQLIQVQSQLVDARREKEKSSQQAADFHAQLDQFKSCDKRQQCELKEELKALRGRLEVAEEHLYRGVEEKTSLQILLEQRTQEGRKFKELLEEKCQEVQLRQQKAQQHLTMLEEAERRCQTLHADGETLKHKLDDCEKVINILRSQMESSTQMMEQHSLTIDKLRQENSLLSNQLDQQKMENQQLRANLDQHKSDLVVVEHEKQRLQASVAEQTQLLKEESLEKQQLTIQLELQRIELLNLKNEHMQLQQLHSCKKEDQEGVVLQLQSQLRNVHDELDQVRRTLRTWEGADGHGLQAARSMQEKITARREQIDCLQGKIQHLEETMNKLYQEKLHQNLQYQHQLEELAFVREEKRQLSNELEALHSKDKQLRARIGQLDTILHKMSESFADCQDFIQLQEQDFYRMKLRHALDLKHTSNTWNMLLKPKRQQESPTRELKSLVKELQAVISENGHRPQLDNNATISSFHRRRSAPENIHRTKLTADMDEEVQAVSKFRRKIYNSELPFPKTSELRGEIIDTSLSERPVISSAVLAGRYISATQLLSPGRRSPVHSLLTSDPNSQK